MTITQLITELEKLKALHGDLPVTYIERDQECRGPSQYIEIDSAYHSEGKYDDSVLGKTVEGPHIHLS
jgi:hypothetical protein